MCGYTAPYFGASYPDACCINGYLWDLDSCDEPGGGLHSGGDDPCPQCNHNAFLGDVLIHKGEEGWLAADDKITREYQHRKLRCEQVGDEDQCRKAWLQGYDQRVEELAAEASKAP